MILSLGRSKAPKIAGTVAKRSQSVTRLQPCLSKLEIGLVGCLSSKNHRTATIVMSEVVYGVLYVLRNLEDKPCGVLLHVIYDRQERNPSSRDIVFGSHLD